MLLPFILNTCSAIPPGHRFELRLQTVQNTQVLLHHQTIFFFSGLGLLSQPAPPIHWHLYSGWKNAMMCKTEKFTGCWSALIILMMLFLGRKWLWDFQRPKNHRFHSLLPDGHGQALSGALLWWSSTSMQWCPELFPLPASIPFTPLNSSLWPSADTTSNWNPGCSWTTDRCHYWFFSILLTWPQDADVRLKADFTEFV